MQTTTEPEDTGLTITAAARELSVSVQTLRRWGASGKIVFTRTLGDHRRVSRAEVDRIKTLMESR